MTAHQHLLLEAHFCICPGALLSALTQDAVHKFSARLVMPMTDFISIQTRQEHRHPDHFALDTDLAYASCDTVVQGLGGHDCSHRANGEVVPQGAGHDHG